MGMVTIHTSVVMILIAPAYSAESLLYIIFSLSTSLLGIHAKQ